MFENVWLSTLRPAQVKDELIRAMKESNSSMRLDSLVLVRPGQLHFGSFAFRSDRSDILVKGFLKFLWPKGHHKSSQAITCYHEHSLHLQMCFAAVLLCKVQATLGKSKCTFGRYINFLQFPSSLGGISAAIQQTQWWDHAQRTRPLSLNFSTPVKHRWSSLTPNSRYGCQGWVSLQRTAFLHLFTSALRCKLDARFCACLNKIAAWLKSKHEGTQIQVCADTWHVGGKSCSDIHVEVRRKPAAFELQQDFVTILAYAPVFWNPII